MSVRSRIHRLSLLRRTVQPRRFEMLEDRLVLAVEHVIHISIDGLAADTLQEMVNADVADNSHTLDNFVKLQVEGAFTYNARTDYTHTDTLPNHTAMLTGRPVTKPLGIVEPVHHNWTDNVDPPVGATLHSNHPEVEYIDSVFDVVHNAGSSTSLFAGKTKFSLFDSSYNAKNGAADNNPVGGDNGRDKIDYFEVNTNTSSLVDSFVNRMRNETDAYTFLHLRDPDSAGHETGWKSSEYQDAIRLVDRYLGRVFDLVESQSRLSNSSAIIVTTDHGGTAQNHADETASVNYTIPFFVWGNFQPGADLYDISSSFTDPGSGRPNFLSSNQPIRNGDSGNLALSLLGLKSIPGSMLNRFSADSGTDNPGPTGELLARDDVQEVNASSSQNALDVLANDVISNRTVIVDVGSSERGTITISTDQRMVLYTPSEGFTGRDQFSYTISSGDGTTSSAQVTVVVQPKLANRDLVFRIEAVDAAGLTVDNLIVGSSFDLQVWVQDVRPNPSGARAAYVDVEFDADLARATGQVRQGALFRVMAAGQVSAGIIDEAGGSSVFGTTGGTEQLLLEVPFVAERAGALRFRGSVADLVQHENRFIDDEVRIEPNRIGFLDSTFEIHELHNSRDPLDVNNDGELTPLDALEVINYLNTVGGRNFQLSVADNQLPQHYLDVNDDRSVAPFDALLVINGLNENARVARAATPRVVQPVTIALKNVAASIDAVFDSPYDETEIKSQPPWSLS